MQDNFESIKNNTNMENWRYNTSLNLVAEI